MHNGGRHHGMNNGEKPKNFKASIAKIFSYDRKFLILMCIGCVCALLSTVLSIVGPDKIKDIANVITEGLLVGIDLEKVRSIALTLVLLYSLSFIFNYLEGIITADVANNFSKKLRSEIIGKINRLPLSYFDKSTVGDTLSRITNDVDTIGHTLNEAFGTLIVAITMFGGSLIMMIKISPIMAAVAAASTIVGFVLMQIILKRSQKYFTSVQRELGNINGHIEEIFSGHSVVKVSNALDEVNEEFDKINERLYENGRKSQFYSGLMHPIMSFVSNFGYVAVCIVGALLTMNGTITFGVIVAFMLYVRLFTQPLTQFAQAMSQLQSTAAASERVFEFLDEEELSSEQDKKCFLKRSEAKGNIEFKNVKFGYDADRLIIKDFNAQIHPGEKVAIVGPTGAGKTTIVNLLMKFYELTSGDIIIDGISTKDMTRENVHDLFDMVLQDTWVFEGTVKDNIRYNVDTVTDEDIQKACQVVGLDHFIRTLPDGYDTVLGDADSLSQGQRQLMTIARSMVDTSPFLILDEATSSVDTRTEELVQKAMDKLTKGRTSFIIAHRLSTIKNADLILVMKDGNIIEQGNHKELLEKNGFYAELYNSQFQNANE